MIKAIYPERNLEKRERNEIKKDFFAKKIPNAVASLFDGTAFTGMSAHSKVFFHFHMIFKLIILGFRVIVNTQFLSIA